MKKDNKEIKEEVKKEEKKVEVVKKESFIEKPLGTFIIGVLVGAIITAAIFLICKPNNGRGNMPQFDRNNMPENFDKDKLPEDFNKEDFEKNRGNRRSRTDTNENSKQEDKVDENKG